MRLGVALGNLGLAIGRPLEGAEHGALVYRIAEAAEELGFHSVWAGDHLALPRTPTTPYPYGDDAALLSADVSLLDPFAVLAAVAGRTERVRLGFGVAVLPYRHPLVVAKLVASIDALSNGRVILGVGTGWMPEEFDAVGADFGARGRDTDAALAYLRRVFADGEADDLTVLPVPVQRPGPPIWVGGVAPAALRRAVEFADGWNAPYADPERLANGIERLHAECRIAGRDAESIDISVHGIAADDVDDALLDAYAALGVTDLGVRLPLADAGSPVHALRDLATRCPRVLDHIG
ncbi:MAG TPA: TIGR03619 family F420-dependent LLM class oxidoreductase [Acidimicrobiia bacterium]|nr:TIGR03619 family F420-dependent LLM class oxidoreductase [Acidimicrobiia bacterium]